MCCCPFSNESIGVTTGRAFCGVVGHRDRHEYTGEKYNLFLKVNCPVCLICEGTGPSMPRLKARLNGFNI